MKKNVRFPDDKEDVHRVGGEVGLSSLAGWSRVINKVEEQRRKEVDGYWFGVASSKYPCLNMSVADLIIANEGVDDNNKTSTIKKDREINCELTKQHCVCSMFSYAYYGYLPDDYLCKMCPGYKERGSKRSKLF